MGCLVRCSRLLGGYHSLAAKFRRLGGSSDGRLSMIHRRQECVIRAGGLHMLGLQ